MITQDQYNAMLGVKPRKHSYRELYKRRTASLILLFIKDREAKSSDYCILNAKAGSARQNTMQVVHAKMVADLLIKEADQYKTMNLSQYAPYKNEIRQALKNTLSSNQLILL